MDLLGFSNQNYRICLVFVELSNAYNSVARCQWHLPRQLNPHVQAAAARGH